MSKLLLQLAGPLLKGLGKLLGLFFVFRAGAKSQVAKQEKAELKSANRRDEIEEDNLAKSDRDILRELRERDIRDD